MKTLQALKVTALSITALGAGYCLGYLNGMGSSQAAAMIGRISLAIFLLFLLAALGKIIVAVLIHRKGGPPSEGGGGGGGSKPPRAPVPRPPGGRPPALSAAAEIKLGSAT